MSIAQLLLEHETNPNIKSDGEYLCDYIGDKTFTVASIDNTDEENKYYEKYFCLLIEYGAKSLYYI